MIRVYRDLMVFLYRLISFHARCFLFVAIHCIFRIVSQYPFECHMVLYLLAVINCFTYRLSIQVYAHSEWNLKSQNQHKLITIRNDRN